MKFRATLCSNSFLYIICLYGGVESAIIEDREELWISASCARMKGWSIMATLKTIEFMCTHCGKKERRNNTMGRPQPGKCPRKPGNQPHTWVVNRTM